MHVCMYLCIYKYIIISVSRTVNQSGSTMFLPSSTKLSIPAHRATLTWSPATGVVFENCQALTSAQGPVGIPPRHCVPAPRGLGELWRPGWGWTSAQVWLCRQSASHSQDDLAQSNHLRNLPQRTQKWPNVMWSSCGDPWPSIFKFHHPIIQPHHQTA